MAGRSGQQVCRIISMTRHPTHSDVEYIVVGSIGGPGSGAGGGAVGDFEGFTFFSDHHQCTPEGDAQQHAPLQVACFIFCDEEVCGGPGGFLVWYSNDPDDLAAGCLSPNNPLPGMLS